VEEKSRRQKAEGRIDLIPDFSISNFRFGYTMITQLRDLLAAIVVGLAFSQVAYAQDPPPAAADAPKITTPTIESAKGDVAAATIIDSNPTTPTELLRAAATLADLGRPDLAKAYLQQLANANPGEEALAEVAGKVDADLLMQIASSEALRPEGRTLASAVLAAGAKRARDPQRLKSVIDQLVNPSRQVQRAAIIEILAAREDAVPALLLAMADKKRAVMHPLVRQTLVQIGRPAVAPLVASLQTEDAALKVQIIDALAQIHSRDAALYLAAPAVLETESADVRQAAAAALESIESVRKPTVGDAVKLLSKEATRYLNGERPLKADADGKVTIWRFEPAIGVPARESVPRDEAAAIIASRITDDLFMLASHDAAAQRLYLITHLQAAAYRAGLNLPLALDEPIVAEALTLGAAKVEDAMVSALSNGQLPAAKGAAQVLGDVGDVTYLDATGAKVRPIVTAVSHGDRRVRFAAAEAMMKWRPESPFAGSSDLIDALAWFAGSPGVKRALVAFPNEMIASELGSMLDALGYEVDVATNGRSAYLQALASGDYELALLSGRLDHPPLAVLLQELRRSPRTKDLPILLLAEEGDGERLLALATGDSLTATIERPLTPQAMKLHVDRLTERTAEGIVPAELRSQQALAALGWLKQLNEASAKHFGIRQHETAIRRSLYSPAHSAAAADLLALIGTHTAQKTLVDLANMATQPLAMRQSAAAAFSRSVRKYGVQLTSAEMQQQYDRYNASEIEDAESQQLLALILDAIEFPSGLKAEGRKQKAESGK
jgi:DNA-binding response OmpR family regulator